MLTSQQTLNILVGAVLILTGYSLMSRDVPNKRLGWRLFVGSIVVVTGAETIVYQPNLSHLTAGGLVNWILAIFLGVGFLLLVIYFRVDGLKSRKPFLVVGASLMVISAVGLWLLKM